MPPFGGHLMPAWIDTARHRLVDVASDRGEDGTPLPSGVSVAPRRRERLVAHTQPVTAVQVPGEVWTLQLTQAPSHAVSQQTPSAPQTPLAHSSVVPQVVPGVFL